MKNKKLYVICWILTPILILTLSTLYKVNGIPNTLFLREGKAIQNSSLIRITENNDLKVSNLNKNQKNEKRVNVSLLGLVSLKTISVKSVPSDIMVYPGGQPIGVKLNTKGVLVVALSDVQVDNKKVTSPASAAGIQVGDSILKVNNNEINSCEDMAREINDSRGKEVDITLDRKGSLLTKQVVPIKSNIDNNFKIGLWVRDSTAGVGTMTFYDVKSGKFAALGHPITDVDTGTILSINSGEIVSSSIVSVRKGLKGNPGELKGIFVDEENSLGQIFKNTECGIFGKSNDKMINKRYNHPIKIALRDEIKEGPAKILTTIEGNEPQFYNIQIEKLLAQQTSGPKSMIIKITDPKLLEKTGGIVQGMSGSPIIQNDKLVGAVTHVLINKPDVGYGIYIEWMLKDAEILSK